MNKSDPKKLQNLTITFRQYSRMNNPFLFGLRAKVCENFGDLKH